MGQKIPVRKGMGGLFVEAVSIVDKDIVAFALSVSSTIRKTLSSKLSSKTSKK